MLQRLVGKSRRWLLLSGLALLCPAPARPQAGSPPGSARQAARPPATEQQILRVQGLLEQGNLAGARDLLDRYLKEQPQEAGFANLLGIVEAREGNYRAAEAAFERAIAHAPGFANAYLNLGRLYQEQTGGDADAGRKALGVYQRLLRHRPDHAEANYQSAVLLQLLGSYRASLAHLVRLPAELQASAQALAVRCADYVGLRDQTQADEAAARLLAHADFSEPDAVSILPTLAAHGRDDLAARLLEGAARRGQVSPESIHRLGLLYERQGQLEQARATMEKSATTGRPLVPLLVDLARVAHKQKDFQGALGYLAHARDLEPQNAGLHYFFGLVCVDLNLGAEAHLALSKAVGLDPNHPDYQYAMGVVSSYRHDPAEALPYLQKYIQLRPQDWRGRLALGAVHYRSKDFPAARRELREALKAPETAAAAHYYLGSIARQEGRLEEALGELGQALRGNPDYADALAELGQCHLQRKEHQAAERALARALEIDPGHYAANFNLLTLFSRTRDARQEAQARRFDEVRQRREERAQEFLRGIGVRPYGDQ